MDEVYSGARKYLRTTSAEQPSKLPANIASDFPNLSKDFGLPEQFAMVNDNAHSSPLRISGPVTLWLHYDVSERQKIIIITITIIFSRVLRGRILIVRDVGDGECPLPGLWGEASRSLSPS